MLPSLRDFYFFHFLPKLVCLNNQLIDFDKKWTLTKEMSRLPNGLVDDINYYKDLPNKKWYTIEVFTKIPTNIREIFISGYMTLDPSQWLSGFSLDILLNLIDEEQEYEIISSCLSTIIFWQTTYSNNFFYRIWNLEKRSWHFRHW